jgi:LPXTG-site transpeptidase (sortase) family protein
MRRIDHHSGAILLGSVFLILSVVGLLGGMQLANSPAARLLGGWFDGVVGLFAAPAAPTLVPTVAILPTSTPFLPDLPTLAPVTATAPAAVDLPAEIPAETIPPQPAEQAEGQFLAPLEPVATPEPVEPAAPPLTPERIVIPAVQLDAPILPATFRLVNYNGQLFQQWDAPAMYAAGWQTSSALIGEPGNTVLNGHHNVNGSVFGRLHELEEGDLIQIFSGGERVDYTVANKMILPEEGMPLEVRFENARWLSASDDERLTLVTCWPQNSNSHRLIIVARPVARVVAGAP